MLRLIFSCLLLSGFTSLAATLEQVNPQLLRGSIIFQNSHSTQSSAILAATGSKYSHVGIIDVLPNNSIVILEAVGPVKETSKNDWVRKGQGKYTVYRIPNLSKKQEDLIIIGARAQLGKPYDPFFYKDIESIYCSELVDLALKKAKIYNIGTHEPVGELLEKIRNLPDSAKNRKAKEDVANLVNRRWSAHPLCKNQGYTKEKCLGKVYPELLISPESIAQALQRLDRPIADTF